MKHVVRLVMMTLVLALVGCTNASVAQFKAYGNYHVVRQYSGGVLIGEWRLKGKVEAETDSDGWFFMDAATGQLVRISGDIQVFALPTADAEVPTTVGSAAPGPSVDPLTTAPPMQ
jgi:hypothetical protein